MSRKFLLNNNYFTMSKDVPKRKEIIKILLVKIDKNLSELAELMDISKQKLNYHFQKEDIDLDLYNKIIDKLIEKGFNIDNSITQTVNGDKGMNYNAAHSKAGQVIENNYHYDRESVSELINTIKFLREQNLKLQADLDACRKKK